MSHEDILAFMQKRGDATKRALHEITVFQTKDAQDSKDFCTQFVDMVEAKKARVNDIDEGVNIFDKIEHECSEEIERLQQEIGETEEKKVAAGHGLEELREAIVKPLAAINANLIKAMNTKL